MATPSISLWSWMRAGGSSRFHVVRDIDGVKAYWTGCGIFHPMWILGRPGTIISAARPVDEAALCRRCRRDYH